MKYEATMVLQPLRLNWHYVIWYKSITSLIASFVVPLTLLAYWNINTFQTMLRRRRLSNRPSGLESYSHSPFSVRSQYNINAQVAVNLLNSNTVEARICYMTASSQGTWKCIYKCSMVLCFLKVRYKCFLLTCLIRYFSCCIAKREEATAAKVLIAIVMFFVICNVPKIVLNLEELVVVAPLYWKNYKYIFDKSLHDVDNDRVMPLCYSPPFWAHILGSISHFLQILNASICCVVYCIISPTFRQEFMAKLTVFIFYVKRIFCNNDH